MDITTYALSKKIAAHALSGVQSMSVSGQTLTINTKDSGVLTITFPTPKDGVSVTDIDVNANNQIVFTMSDGSEIISGKIPTVKGDKGDPGFSPTITENADNTDKIYKLDIETIDGKFTTPNLKGADGTGGEGASTWSEISDKPFESLSTDFSVENGELKVVGTGEENTIESISVNGTPISIDENKNVDITVPSIDGLAKTEDIPTKVSELTNDSGYLTEHQDISGKVDKVDGKSLIADTEIERLASVDNYDDTQVKTQIQAVANGLMDSVGYSADYKTIDIIAKNGVKKSVNVAPIISHASITELSDVDTTNKATGKALVYNATTSKHEYADVSGTDEKVKMDASTDAKYLGELLDNVTIANENGELKVKKLDGQEVTVTEINYLKGLTMNVMDLVNMFSNGGVKIINTPVATYAELLTLDKSSFIEGISYLVYVLADENHDNAKTTYLVDKDSETPTYFGFADSQRDFTTNPIDLATEITGKLGIANMDSDAIKALFTVDDTYKTETVTNNAFSTHGAKALYDELFLAIGNKANNSDLASHKDDTDIHVSTEDRTKWNSAKTHADSAHAPSNAQANVLETVKVNGTALEVSNKAVNVTVPTTVAELADNANYAKKTDIPTTLPANGGNADTVNNHTVETDVPTDAKFTDTIYDDTEVKENIKELSSNLDGLEFGEVAGGKNLIDLSKATDGYFINQATGNLQNTSSGVLATDFIEVVSGEKYYYSGMNSLNRENTGAMYDNNKNYVGSIVNDVDIQPLTIPTNVQYIRLNIWKHHYTDVKKAQLEEGNTATPYEPYIPSVKMLAEENAQHNTEAMDLKMLGWTVPKECPIQNEVSGNQFIQKVGRVDLGSLNWVSVDTNTSLYTASIKDIKTLSNNIFLLGYSVMPYDIETSKMINKNIKMSGLDKQDFYIKNDSYTDATSFKNDMQGEYLYYELATPITMTIDGNEVTERLNESLSVIGKCKNLLNPTFDTYTHNGVTFTKNNDGTYSLSGSRTDTSSSAYISFIIDYPLEKGRYKLTGALDENNNIRCIIKESGSENKNIYDYGKGVILDISKPNTTITLMIVTVDDTSQTRIVKPMLTTDLNTTYDDFVPYTGEGETLTHDVAEIKNTLVASNAGAHNCVYRGKYLGNALTAEQKVQISAGTFNDLYIGDYWTIGGVNYRIAAFDYWLRCGDTDLTTHHVVIVPDSNLYTHVMNDTNITTGGYVGSKMYTEGLNQAKETIKNAFGEANILTHREYLTNATTNGYASAGAWYDSQVELMNENMIYGSAVFRPQNSLGATIPNSHTLGRSQLPLFAFRPDLISNRQWYWLRDVVNATYFASVSGNGATNSGSANNSSGVRPAFGITGGAVSYNAFSSDDVSTTFDITD